MTAYEMRISVLSSDVCSSDLIDIVVIADRALRPGGGDAHRACHRPQRVAELGVGFCISAVADSVLPIGVEIIGKADVELRAGGDNAAPSDRKSTRLNSSH